MGTYTPVLGGEGRSPKIILAAILLIPKKCATHIKISLFLLMGNQLRV